MAFEKPSWGFIFTLILIASPFIVIGIPNCLESKHMHSGQCCIPFPTIKSIGTAQDIFREKVELDADGDGLGEYAMNFAHLAGIGTATGTPVLGMVPVASDTSLYERRGYIFKIFIPSRDAGGSVDDDETSWSVAAWPKKWDKTGNTCYFMAEDGIAYEKKQPTAGAVVYDGSTLYDGMGAQMEIYDCYSIPFNNATILAGKAGLVAKK